MGERVLRDQESPKGATRGEACLDPEDLAVVSGQPSHTMREIT